MSSHTWPLTLIATTDKNAVLNMRTFLRQRGIIVPMRDRDVVTKYLQRLIETGNARNIIEMPFRLSRAWAPAPWQPSYKAKRRPGLFDPPRLPEHLRGLALGSFGLLLMLACYVAFCG